MSRSHFRSACSCLVILFGLGGSIPLAAQPLPSAGDSLKAEIAQQRSSLAAADSTGDLRAGFETRIQLARSTRKTEAVSLLKQAAVLADSLGRPDLGAMAHGLLAKRFASMGDHAAAYAEVVLGDSLEDVFQASQLDSLDDRYASELDRVAVARDSVTQASAERERRLAIALVDVQRAADRWMYITLATAVLCLLIVIGLLYRMGNTGRKLHATIEALRKEVDEQRRTGNRRKEVLSPKEDLVSDPIAGRGEVIPSPVNEAMKPVTAGIFRKGAPERLATLRQARKRGDVEKVLRVVHTLKPQLVSFDEERFAPLCARLTALGASGNTAQWSADLDILEAGVQELLSRNMDH